MGLQTFRPSTVPDPLGTARARAPRVQAKHSWVARIEKGCVAYHAGLAAEDQVARMYDRSGRPICARRWRGAGGEIDLIARDGDEVIFIEVKKSRTHALAAEHLTPRQMARIYASASEFLAGDVRFDVALVDATGEIEILENAFAA